GKSGNGMHGSDKAGARSGFEVAGRTYDGLSGLSCIKSTNPEVAILDSAMPALDGYALARLIRSEIGSPPRLVALTGNKSEAINAGFDAYFRKSGGLVGIEGGV